MGKVIVKKIGGLGWMAKVGLVTIVALLTTIFIHEGWYKPRSGEAATVVYNFTLDAAAVNIGADGSTSTASTSGGAGKFSMTSAVPGTRTTNIGFTTLGTGETTVGTIYGPAYATPQNLTAPALVLAVSRNSSQNTETWKAYIYDYDPAGAAGNQTLLWTTGTATQSSSTASQVTLSLSGAAQKTVAAGHRIKIVVVASGTSGNTANLYARYSSTVYSAFTVTEAVAGPAVSSLSPATGNPGTTTDVIITGNGFVNGAQASFGAGITVNGTSFTSATSLTANITIDSAAAPGARTVTVTNPDTTSGSLTNGFQVVSANAPTISSLSPASLGQGATAATVAITGTNFDATSQIAISGTGVTATTTYVDATHLTAAITVAGTATVGARDVTVTNSSDGSSSTKTGALTVTARPTVTAASPISGALGWTGNVTITGTGFVSGATVSFSGAGVTVNGPVTWNSATSLTANVTVAAGAALGGRTVTVTNPDFGNNVSATNLFTVFDPSKTPTITLLSPSAVGRGAANIPFTITGTNFDPAATVTRSGTNVTLGTMTVVNSTTITGTIASVSNTGTSTITVTNPDTQTATATLTLNTYPSTPTASPASGSTGQTMNVTIGSGNLVSGATVSFSGTGITVNSVTFNSASSLTANITIDAAATAGARSVTVTNPDYGTRTASNIFTVTPVGVTSASPSTIGQGAQNVNVSITGQGFVTGATAAFSGSGITVNSVTVNSPTSLTANVNVSASATAGARNITVTNTDATTATGTGLVTVVAAPTLTTVSPATGREGDTLDVAINGTNFQNGAAASFSGSGITVNSTIYVSATRLTANVTIGANAPLGVRTVTVVNPDGGIVTGGSFTVTYPDFTIPGAMSFSKIGKGTITVTVPFTGDNDRDNGCVIRWGDVAGSYPNSAAAVRSGNSYVATVTGLPDGPDGSGKLFFFQATFSDPDGVVGNNPVTGFQSAMGSSLMHTSLNLGSDKWPQGWGIAEGKYGAFTCSTCHSRTATNAKLVATSIQSPSMENWSSTGLGNSATVSVFYKVPATDLGSDAAHASSTRVCEVCHSRTDHHRNANAAANHMGTTDCTTCHSHSEGFSPDSAGGRDCSLCHGGILNPMATGTASYHHHLDASAVASATYPTTATPSESQKACLQCHADHNVFRSDINTGNSVGRAANLRVDATVVPVAGAPGTTYTNTDFVASATNGGICVSCHLNQQTKTATQLNDGTTVTMTVAKADFTGSMHNYTASSVFKKDRSQFVANCSKCHNDTTAKNFQASGGDQFANHDSGIRQILNPLGNAAPTDPYNEALCYRCHSRANEQVPGAGTVKTADTQDWYGSRTMGADAIDTFSSFYANPSTAPAAKSFGHHPANYSGQHKQTVADENLTYIAQNKHVECADCHDPHVAGKNNRPQATGGAPSNVVAAGSPIAGVSGVTTGTWPAMAASTSWGTPAKLATTWTLNNTATQEWQICFKCHSGANANVLTTWSNSSLSGAARWTDLALEFNPNNKSAHPVVASLNSMTNAAVGPNSNKGVLAAYMKAPWNTNVGNQTMYCTDCHETDSAASRGPHGSSVKWMLSGANKAWPYTTAAQNGGNSGTFFALGAGVTAGDGTKDGLFCLNCHVVADTNGAHDMLASNHRSSGPGYCISCHIRVPHGGRVARLIRGGAAAALGRYAPDGNGGEGTAGAFYLQNYSKGTQTSNTRGSFKCSTTTEHSGGTDTW